jgi:hypothetical protein
VNRLGRAPQAPALIARPGRTPAATVVKRAGLVILAAAVLFFCYWRQSQSAPLSSDGAGNVLQAWDMLHGNLPLHNWWVSDVSFYTTELPEYMLIEALAGLGTSVVHAAAAMTYTLLVLLAALVAKGRTPGFWDPAGLARALLTAGLMLAPQLGATEILLLAPDHTGTAVPLLLTWLLIDRASPGGRPPGIPLGLVPVLVGLLFLWTMVADSIVLLTGIVPLVLVCLVRACPGLVRGGERPAPRWYEPALAGAAAVAGLAGEFAPRIMTALGGYHQSHVAADIYLGQLQHGAWVTFQAFLELFGANVFDASSPGAEPAVEVVFAALHMAGAITVAWALGLAARRFFRFGELIVPVFAVAIVLNLGAYMISTHARYLLGAREMAEVLPLGAVLAGRILGDRLLTSIRAAKSRLVPVLSVLTAGYLAALGYGAAQASVPSANQPLAAWLVAHRLSDGLADYWQANSTTVDSRRQVLVSAVTYGDRGQLVPYQWETDDANYDPARHYANFVVADGPAGLVGLQRVAELTFGRPARVYHADGYTIMVWNTNLLDKLDGPGPT